MKGKTAVSAAARSGGEPMTIQEGEQRRKRRRRPDIWDLITWAIALAALAASFLADHSQ